MNRPRQGGMAEDQDALDALAQCGVEQQPVPGDRAPTRTGVAGRLGEKRQPGGLGQFAGAVPDLGGGVPGQHDGARARDQLGRHGRTRTGDRGQPGRLRIGHQIIDEGFGEGGVDVHRAGLAGAQPEPCREQPRQLRGPRCGRVVAAGQRQVADDMAAEDAYLMGGLVGAGAHQRGRTIGRDDHQHHPGGAGLHHRRHQIADRGSRGHQHRRCPARLGQPQGEEAAGAFIGSGVQPDSALAGQAGQGQRHRRAA